MLLCVVLVAFTLKYNVNIHGRVDDWYDPSRLSVKMVVRFGESPSALVSSTLKIKN